VLLLGLMLLLTAPNVLATIVFVFSLVLLVAFYRHLRRAWASCDGREPNSPSSRVALVRPAISCIREQSDILTNSQKGAFRPASAP
jgi:apolipoprotein N-acyltransferase